MINNSKILTVSYGTFSCTLEGFDDSFGTMKAIAEYFRDLAADDRYFGAEPPTPDAEMLARIAEREIARRVEAHKDGGKIVLRAEEAAPAALPADPVGADHVEDAPKAEAPAPAARTEAPSFTAPMPAAPAAPAYVAEDEAPTEVEEAEEALEEVSEHVEEVAEEPVSAPDFAASIAALTAEDAAEADEVAPRAEDKAAEDAETAEEEAHTPDAEEPEAVMPEVAAPEAETLVDFAEEEVATEDEDAPIHEDAETSVAPVAAPEQSTAPEEVPHPDPDSVAAKLRRIRSVVAQSDEGYGDTDYSEDEHAQDFLDDTAAELDAALAADDAAELSAAEEEADVSDETDTLIANLAGPAEEDEEPVVAEDETPEAATQEADEDGPSEPLLSEESPAEDRQIEDTLAQLLADAMPEDTDTADAEADAFDDEEDAEAEVGIEIEAESVDQADPVDEAEPADDAEAAHPLDARVVNMKRSALDEAMASGVLAEERKDEDTVNLFSDEAEDDFENALSPEEEAELQRELAAVEADFAPETEADDEDASIEMADDNEAESEAGIEAEADTALDMAEDEMQEAHDDAATAAARGVDRLHAVERTSDVSRIFDEADSQREDADSSARRNAIQHLRAAVAATRADQNAGVDISSDKDDSAYRSDLADMVRPRRPRADGSPRSARPGVERPAPLKLVAEQRIDTPRDPVQPRRIRTSDITDEATQATGDTSGSFADFAEEMGAGSLPELLEAAAAYMADVEGRPQFSRPMLMGKLKEVEGDTFSREDGLRSFGQLLRQGKLQKLQGGRFAITDETEFRVETRNAG